MPERKLEYESLKHKAEGGFMLKAPSLERLYIDTALALTDQMTGLDRIKELQKKTVTIKATTREGLMLRWLNEILRLFNEDKFLSKRITFQKFDGKQVTATLFGDLYDSLRHGNIPEYKPLGQGSLQMGEIHDQELQFFIKLSVATV